MSDFAGGRVAALYRYPVKGLTPERMNAVTLQAGSTMPADRAYAVENGPGPFDPNEPKYVAKIHFVMLMRNEQLASVKSLFDDASHTLTIFKNGDELAHGDLRTPDGRSAIETAISAIVGSALRGPPRVVAAPGHSFSDVSAKCLHVINLESVRALEIAMGVQINPLRFRPNLIVDGWPAWAEFDLVGQSINAGTATLKVFKRTERCAATNVDPDSGARDLKIPSFLSRSYGHSDFGVYAKVSKGGELKIDDHIDHAA